MRDLQEVRNKALLPTLFLTKTVTETLSDTTCIQIANRPRTFVRCFYIVIFLISNLIKERSTENQEIVLHFARSGISSHVHKKLSNLTSYSSHLPSFHFLYLLR
jgi:hypothetical protein